MTKQEMSSIAVDYLSKIGVPPSNYAVKATGGGVLVTGISRKLNRFSVKLEKAPNDDLTRRKIKTVIARAIKS